MTETHQQPSTPIVRRRPWLTWTMGALFALGVLYWWLGARTITYMRSLMATHYAVKAQEWTQQKEWNKAWQNLAKARSWLVNDPHVLRAYADLLIVSRSDDLSLLQVLRLLESYDQSTAADRIYIGQILISLGRVTEARTEYEKLTEKDRHSRESLELLSSLYAAEGHPEKAEKTLREALSLNPNDPESRLRLAILDHQNSFAEIQAHSREVLWELAQSKDEIALQAIEFLITRAQVDGEEAEKLLELIEAHPTATAKTRYSALSARLRARPQDRQAVLAAEIERVRGKGVEILAPALTWLLQENQPQSVIDILPDQLYLKSGQLLHPYLLAQSALGNWSEIESLLSTQRTLPVSQSFLHLWKARTAEKLDIGIKTIRHHLEAAYAQSGRGQDETTARMTAEIAEQMGQWDLAAEYYGEIASKQPLSQVSMLEKVYEMALRERDTNAALKSARELAKLNPENQTFTQRARYLELIAGDAMELTLLNLKAQEPIRADSTTPLLRALAAFRLGDLEHVKQHLAEIGSTDTFTPGEKAAHAGLLSICGEIGPAFRMAETIPGILLLPEELRFLRRAL